MVATAEKTAKVTAAMLDEYVEAKTQRTEIERMAKPYADKEKALAKQIIAGLEAAGVTNLKRGQYRAMLIEKAGLVPWKDECTKRLAAGELEAIQEALPTRTSLDVQPA